MKKKNNQKPKRRILLSTISAIVAMIVVFGISGTSTAVLLFNEMLKDTPVLDVNDFISPESTKIYDSKGELIADIGLKVRENITYAQMPQVLIDAFVAIEDSRFFTHNGFDLPRFTKAIIENLRSGFGAQGGSTFTMQLVKNTYFASEESNADVTIERKVQEISLAIQLENEMSKKRILELYVNKVNYGVPSSYGIYNASQYYFGKEIEQLTLSEAAYLAGVVNAPGRYQAYKSIDKATERRNEVLYFMFYHGYITESEYEAAKSIKLEDLLAGDNLEGTPSQYQAYIDAVVAEVKELTGFDPAIVPMNIFTHMERSTQELMEAIQNEETTVKFPNDLLQTAGVSMDVKTGEVIAIGGGRFYYGERLYNRATSAFHNPGSSVKPLLDYALALEYLGYSTGHVILDEPIMWGGTDKVVRNFDRSYNGEIRMMEALARSINVPAIKTLQEVVNKIGSAKVVEYLQSLGFSKVFRGNNGFDLGYAIGGSTFTATPVEMLGAYGMLLNGGVYTKPHTVSRIEFRNGDTPIVPTYASVRVLSAEAAYLTTYMMEYSVEGPFGNYMKILNRSYPVFAKSGTSDWGSDGEQYGIPNGAAKDMWMVAGTSRYLNVVWLGFDKAIAGEETWITSAIARANIHGHTNRLLLNHQETLVTSFPEIRRPAGVVDITHVLGVYPYAAPIDGMNPALITSGMIKREFANLTTLTPPVLSNLTDVTVVMSSSGPNKRTISSTLTSYPIPEDLVYASNVLQMELDTGDGIVKATGARLYHPSWIFGPVRYFTSVSVNGGTPILATSDQNVINIEVDIPANGDTTINVCGFYAFESATNIRSNQICKTVNAGDANLTVPKFTGGPLTAFINWITSYNLKTPILTMVEPLLKNQIGIITDISPDVEGQAIKSSDLKKITFETSYYDKNVSFVSIINQTKLHVQTLWTDAKFFNITYEPADAPLTATVKEVVVNGNVVTSQKLSLNNNIIIRLQ
jgi:penicillin-binding protein 1A